MCSRVVHLSTRTTVSLWLYSVLDCPEGLQSVRNWTLLTKGKPVSQGAGQVQLILPQPGGWILRGSGEQLPQGSLRPAPGSSVRAAWKMKKHLLSRGLCSSFHRTSWLLCTHMFFLILLQPYVLFVLSHYREIV